MLKRIWQLITMTFSIWAESNASRMAAALSYYTMLSLAPCLMMAIAIAGYIYEDSVVESEIVRQVKLISSPEIAETVKGLIQRASQPRSGLVAGTVSVCVLVFAASGVFTQLYDTFNDIWGVSYQGLEGLLFTIRKRLIGVGMVLVVGVMLIGALITDSIMTYLSTMMEDYPQLVTSLSLFDRSLSFLLMPLVFMLMFWFFPATKIHWKDVWPAGILTAALVAGSRYLIGFYLKFSTTSEVYGAMGSLVVILIWVYITGLMVFFGASFSHAWADTFGSRSDFLKSDKTAPSEIASGNSP
jgi:membrane protein|tara:strand:+ start:1700 stop:2596 length:897 start_codon:yes stop_codon:yes gene_type:complete